MADAAADVMLAHRYIKLCRRETEGQTALTVAVRPAGYAGDSRHLITTLSSHLRDVGIDAAIAGPIAGTQRPRRWRVRVKDHGDKADFAAYCDARGLGEMVAFAHTQVEAERLLRPLTLGYRGRTVVEAEPEGWRWIKHWGESRDPSGPSTNEIHLIAAVILGIAATTLFEWLSGADFSIGPAIPAHPPSPEPRDIVGLMLSLAVAAVFAVPRALPVAVRSRLTRLIRWTDPVGGFAGGAILAYGSRILLTGGSMVFIVIALALTSWTAVTILTDPRGRRLSRQPLIFLITAGLPLLGLSALPAWGLALVLGLPVGSIPFPTLATAWLVAPWGLAAVGTAAVLVGMGWAQRHATPMAAALAALMAVNLSAVILLSGAVAFMTEIDALRGADPGSSRAAFLTRVVCLDPRGSSTTTPPALIGTQRVLGGIEGSFIVLIPPTHGSNRGQTHLLHGSDYTLRSRPGDTQGVRTDPCRTPVPPP